MKIYEQLRQFRKKELVIRGATLSFTNFTLMTQVNLEAKGLDIAKVFEAGATSPTTSITTIAYELLTEETKKEIGTLNNFRECLSVDDLEAITTLVMNLITESFVKESEIKNAQGAV